MKIIPGGVCSAKGFKASGVHCGLRKNKVAKDLALIVSDITANAAAVYTENLVKGAPLIVTGEHLANGKAQAIICNCGNANTCNANGVEVANEMCALVSAALNIPKSDVIVASTGVIGQPLPIAPIKSGMSELVNGLSVNGSSDAASAIITTDLRTKETAVEFELGGKTCHIGGIAKGSGMIHPNMATMLSFITTDVAITSEMLQKALSADILSTYNMISVDGDTSTNDMVTVLANGLAGNDEIAADGEAYNTFLSALNIVNTYLAREIAKDGEGATKLLTCSVSSAKDKASAIKVAKGVICSSLLKAAMFGADANWGRVLSAIGNAGADVDINKVSVSFKSCSGEVHVCENGFGIEFSEEAAKKVLTESEVDIMVSLNSGSEAATAWGCDLTYDYVKINGDYRS